MLICETPFLDFSCKRDYLWSEEPSFIEAHNLWKFYASNGPSDTVAGPKQGICHTKEIPIFPPVGRVGWLAISGRWWRAPTKTAGHRQPSDKGNETSAWPRVPAVMETSLVFRRGTIFRARRPEPRSFPLLRTPSHGHDFSCPPPGIRMRPLAALNQQPASVGSGLSSILSGVSST